MTYRSARRGGAVAGALLLALPIIEVFYGFGQAGPVHYIVAALGISLIAVSGRLR